MYRLSPRPMSYTRFLNCNAVSKALQVSLVLGDLMETTLNLKIVRTARKVEPGFAAQARYITEFVPTPNAIDRAAPK